MLPVSYTCSYIVDILPVSVPGIIDYDSSKETKEWRMRHSFVQTRKRERDHRSFVRSFGIIIVFDVWSPTCDMIPMLIDSFGSLGTGTTLEKKMITILS